MNKRTTYRSLQAIFIVLMLLAMWNNYYGVAVAMGLCSISFYLLNKRGQQKI